jgi:hypothetical protein
VTVLLQHGIRNYFHETDIAPAVNEAITARNQFAAHLRRRLGILSTPAPA